jgi:hypothetical protein
VLNVEAGGASLADIESVSAAGGANTARSAADRARRAQGQAQRLK